MVVCLSGSDAESSVILVCRCSFNLVLARLKQLNRVSIRVRVSFSVSIRPMVKCGMWKI